MPTDQLKQLEKEILKIKHELLQLAPMRPGSLSLQYKLPAEKKAPYYQLSYTHKMRSRLNMCGRNGSLKSKTD